MSYHAANSICGQPIPAEPMTEEMAANLPVKTGDKCPHCGARRSGDMVAYVENRYEGTVILECGACEKYYKKPYRSVFTGGPKVQDKKKWTPMAAGI